MRARRDDGSLLAALGLDARAPWDRWAAADLFPTTAGALDLAALMTPEVFLRAWRRVRTPGGAGVDGRGRAWYERNLARHLADLRAVVLAGRLRPAPLLHRVIPKPDGGERRLGIPTLGDRLVQAAVLEVVGPRVEALLRPWVHGYRPGHSCRRALADLARQVGERPWIEVLKADVEGLFDHLDHTFLLRVVAALSPDPLWLSLNRGWLRSWPCAPGLGVPQGAPLSPLLANLYLHHALDLPLERARTGLDGTALSLAGSIRYADDLALAGASPGSGPALLRWLEGTLHRASLRLSSAKSVLRCGLLPPAPFTLLGEQVQIVPAGACQRLEVLSGPDLARTGPPGALPPWAWRW